MRIAPRCMLLAVMAGCCLSGAPAALGAGGGGTNVDTVRFIQYLDENTALEEVRNGNLDLYYYRISPDRIENAQSREGLRVFESTGGSYSILVNPAESETFNPFSVREVRFALNYLVDRNLIVNELMGGYGVPMVSNYGPFDPEYLAVLGQLERFRFRYDPGLADAMITRALEAEGAERGEGGTWMFGDEPVGITVFIRSDDPVRRSIGEILASELEAAGFEVARDFGDLNKAFVVVYGSDPAENRWNLYTEGWGGRSAFVRYDPVGLAQMYAPWFSSMPGFNNPAYWNYENGYLDNATQRIYGGDFKSPDQRNLLIREATAEAVGESVRIFLAGGIDQYVAGGDVGGIINDFGAGVPTRFTPINARTGDGELAIGVKQIYQGAWNPVRGLTDSYSTHIWNPVSDPAVFKHPFTGDTVPVRAHWSVETGGPDGPDGPDGGGGIAVPDGAILWNPELQEWDDAGGRQVTSKVTFDLEFGNWHNGEPMDMYDILHSVYFALEWGGTPTGDGDRTFDTEYTPQAAQMVSTLVGVRPVGDSRIEVYVDYWHFDEAEIADRASVWSVMPWEVFSSMERAVLDGKASFSRSGAVSKNVGWLSLIVPDDAAMIRENLEGFGRDGFVPAALAGFGLEPGYFDARYGSSAGWIDRKNHAVISNGPFYLESYVPESRTITLRAFDDPSYPFGPGHWSRFEEVMLPTITGVRVGSTLSDPEDFEVGVETRHASEIRYFISDGDGGVVASGMARAGPDGNTTVIPIPREKMRDGTTGTVRIFAVSDDVLRPDFYSTSFVVGAAAAAANDGIPIADPAGRGEIPEEPDGWALPWALTAAASAALAAGSGIIIYRKRIRRPGHTPTRS